LASFADYSAATHDVRITQGDTFSEALLMEDGDGDPIDLANYSFASQLRRTADEALIVNFTVNVDTSTSTVTRTLSPNVTATLTGTYVHDFQQTNPSGQVRTLFSGEFEIEPEVTR